MRGPRAVVTPAEIAWEICTGASIFQGELEALYGRAWVVEQKAAFRTFMCAYFNAEGGCAVKCGKSVSPVGGAPDGGKRLKVRWSFPGCGKSGGLRILVVARCEERRVLIVAIDRRSNDPDFA